MFFVLSKLLLFLIKPLNWIIGLLLISWITKNPVWKRRLFVAGMIFLLFFTNGFISNQLLKWWEVEPVPIATLENYQTGIVLGGVTNTSIKPRDRVYFHKGADRLTHALQLYKQGIIEKIVVTGGNSELIKEKDDIQEADNMIDFYLMAGVPEEDIIVENQARNTHESAVYCKQILNKLYPSGKHLVITSAFHQRRAKACFDKVDLNVNKFSCDFNTGRGDEFNIFGAIMPSAGAINQWEILLKEWAGMIAYKLKGYI